jgi:hypothetical protein
MIYPTGREQTTYHRRIPLVMSHIEKMVSKHALLSVKGSYSSRAKAHGREFDADLGARSEQGSDGQVLVVTTFTGRHPVTSQAREHVLECAS